MTARYRRADRIDWVVTGDEAVLFDSESGALFELDQWAASIWAALDGNRSMDDITATIAASVDAPHMSVQNDIATFCAQLAERNLIVPATGAPSR